MLCFSSGSRDPMAMLSLFPAHNIVLLYVLYFYIHPCLTSSLMFLLWCCPKNVMAMTLPSLCSSPSPLYGLIRKPFTVTPISVHWKLSLLHDRNFIFIHLFCNLVYHYLFWLLRMTTTNVIFSFSTEREVQHGRSWAIHSTCSSSLKEDTRPSSATD